MDLLIYSFPVSGVTTSLVLPPLVAFLVSTVTSMGGVSGAFLLLPYQMSCLGFVSPAASSTNLVYNIVAIPSGVIRYAREGRMVWPLTWVMTAGTLPGLVIGYFVRVRYLPDPRSFKLFVGCVLFALGTRLILTAVRRTGPTSAAGQPSTEREEYRKDAALSRPKVDAPPGSSIRTVHAGLSMIEYEYRGDRFRFSVPAMFTLAFAVGIIGGTYGIGGGAIIAPFCVAVFRLPVHTVAGAALYGTFLTSVAGVAVYSLLPSGGVPASPDWALGALFGLGGLGGMYLGARLQKHVSQQAIKLLLGTMIMVLAFSYIAQFFR